MKRSFSSQIVLTLCLIFLTMIILSGATQFIYYRASLDLARSELSSVVEAESGVLSFLPASTARNNQQVRIQLNYTARATGKDTIVCDENGVITACSCGLQSCEHLGSQLPTAFLDLAKSSDTGFSAKVLLECYDDTRMAAVKLVTDSGGRTEYVIASVPTERILNRMSGSFKLNLIVMLMVMLLSIPIVWWIVQRQTKPIKLMTTAAAQSERKREEFVANVSHELKTPMTTISGYMDGMLDGTIPPEQQRKYMEIISGEVKRLSRLVRSMLEVSRIQDKGIPAERKRSFDLCQVVGEVLLSFEQKINGKSLNVETDLPDAGAISMADPDAITQVVYNLIDNAVKFCPEKGTLGLRVKEAKGGKYLVSVSNTGPTIPAEELPLVFDRFHKTDKSRSVDRDGWGLGLYIVKTIILAHEEDIYVTSRDGVTEFTFTMPKTAKS